MFLNVAHLKAQATNSTAHKWNCVGHRGFHAAKETDCRGGLCNGRGYSEVLRLVRVIPKCIKNAMNPLVRK